jgi:hypothetical protein
MRRIPHYVQVLISALQLRGAYPEALRALDHSEWRELLEFCDLAHLTLPLWRNCNDVLPNWVRERMERNAADNANRFDNIKRVYLEAAKAFDKVHIKHLVIKGFAQYPGYVEDPRLRMQSDIDIYCPSETFPSGHSPLEHSHTEQSPSQSILRARDALQNLGYLPLRGLERLPQDHLPSMVRKTGWRWRGNAFDPEMPPSIELHFCLWNQTNARFTPRGLQDFWPRRVTRELGDFKFPALDPVDNLGFSALHALRDLLSGDWVLHRIYEIARFLHANAANKTFWSRWRELHSDSLRSCEAISFRLAKDWFACDLPEEAQNEVGSLSPAVQQWFHLFSGSPLKGMFQNNKDGVWLHIALLESAEDRRTVLRNALLPGRMPALGAPGQDTTRQGRRKRFWPSHQYAGYLLYLASRATYHAKTFAPTLLHGAQWRFASRDLGDGFRANKAN